MHQHPRRPPIGWLLLATLAIAACDVESAPNPPEQPAPGSGHILLNIVSALATGIVHGTTGNSGLATPQFVLNLRDASTAGGAVVATAPVPATPNAATANAWVMTYTATATGTFEIIVGTAAAYNVAFGMDYELQVE